MNKTMRYSNFRLLETEVALSVIDVGILAIVPECAPNLTTGLYRLVELVSALIICTIRVI